jgi:hypothetical protein
MLPAGSHRYLAAVFLALGAVLALRCFAFMMIRPCGSNATPPNFETRTDAE